MKTGNATKLFATLLALAMLLSLAPATTLAAPSGFRIWDRYDVDDVADVSDIFGVTVGLAANNFTNLSGSFFFYDDLYEDAEVELATIPFTFANDGVDNGDGTGTVTYWDDSGPIYAGDFVCFDLAIFCSNENAVVLYVQFLDENGDVLRTHDEEAIDALIGAIEDYDGGTGSLAADFNLDTLRVTVTGTVTGAESYLELYIPDGVTVLWNAALSSVAAFHDDVLLYLYGEGTFIVGSGGSLAVSGDYNDTILTDGVAVIVRGTVTNSGDADFDNAAIYGEGNVILETGGTISATGAGCYAVRLYYGSFTNIGGILEGDVFAPDPGAGTLIVNGTSYTDLWDAQAAIDGLLNTDGVDVTVAGAWSGIAKYTLQFYIPDGLTLTWQADISNVVSDVFLWFDGSGAPGCGSFVLDGGNISCFGYRTKAIISESVDIGIRSGSITAVGEESVALHHYGGDITVSGGTVSASGAGCRAIHFGYGSGALTINGGTVRAQGENSYAVYIEYWNSDATYNHTGGTVDGRVYVDAISALVEAIEGYSDAFTVNLNAVRDTVTVTGTVTGAESRLDLSIPDGVTVLWNAALSSAAAFGDDDLLDLYGKGTFIVGPGGSLAVSGEYNDTIHTEGVAVIVQGTVTNSGDADFDNAAIYGEGDVTLEAGGTISATGADCYAACLYDSDFSYHGGTLVGDIYPKLPAPADISIHYYVHESQENETFRVSLPALPANIGAEYEVTTVSGDGVVDNSVTPPSVTGAALTFATLTGLDPDDADIIEVKVKSHLYDDYFVSITVTVLDDAEPIKHQTPVAVIDYAAEALAGLVPDAEYTVDAVPVSADGDGRVAIDPDWFDATVELVRPGDGEDYSDSDPQEIDIPARPAAPDNVGSADTTGGGANGVITGVDYTMEFKLSTAGTWTAISGNSVTGLAAGTYDVRVKATVSSFASEAVSVSIAPSSGSGGTGVPSAPSYSFQDGISTFTPETKNDIVVTISKALSMLKDVKMDGVALVRDRDFEAAGGQAVITLLAEYLETLSPGTHKLEVSFTDGTAISATVTVEAAEEEQNRFTDVTEDDWFYEDVLYVSQKGLMTGTAANVFGPNITMTRAMVVTILYRAAGSPAADPIYAAHMMDVEQDSWYEDAMGWAVEKGIISGYGEGLYGPGDPVTREQFVTLLHRYAGLPALTDGQLAFTDAGAVSAWAFDAFVWSANEGIITGKPGNLLDPQGQVSRAEAAAILHRFLELTVE